jgi:hypothetical protein
MQVQQSRVNQEQGSTRECRAGAYNLHTEHRRRRTIVNTQAVGVNADVEWLHEIGSQIAAGDTLDEALATPLNFAGALVNCDACFIYVRDVELELSV